MVALLALAGCASNDDTSRSGGVTPPSLGPRFETVYRNEAMHPALRTEAGLLRGQTTSFLYEEDRVYAVKACAGGRMTSIKLPPSEELTGESIASFGDTDPTKWGIAARKGGQQWVISVAAKAPGLTTDMVATTNLGTYPFEFTSKAAGCNKMVAIVRPKKVAVKIEVPGGADMSKMNTRYSVWLKKGKKPGWMPLRAFDLGTQKIWVEFPDAPGKVGAPAILASDNFPVQPRIDGNFYQVDTHASSFQLRLGKSIVVVEKGTK